ncbi:MAG: queuosine precursor transporter [bacterium]
MSRSEFSAYVFLMAVFVAALVTANVLAGKIIVVAGLFVPAGVLAYSITFAATDAINEIWGRKRSQLLVNAGFLVLLMVWALNALAIALPAAPFWEGQEAFDTVLSTTNRIIVAGLIAYAVSQSLDIWIFDRLKEMFRSRHLWLRNNVSTLLSQTVDTCVFITIAFYGEFPLLPLIVGQLSVKYVIALLDTPVVYGIVAVVRMRLGENAPAAG